ncbi:MAG TPA: hypothetical protein VM942_03935 [Acidimicrobiales bacterium]|nr:hypothetical protein [Acidimicrobiales bacterium]
MGSIALLAMAPSGETYMVRDEFGRTWLIQPPGAGDPRVIEPDVVELAVARHGFDKIDQDFPSWSDLDRFRQARAASAAPPLAVEARPLDLDDVERLFRVVRRWADQGEVHCARRAVFALLAAPAVRADAEVHGRLIAFVQGLEEPASPFVAAPTSEEKRRARDRYRAAA